MRFAEFLNVVGFTSTDAQAVLCSVLFDGECAPDDDLGRVLFGGTLADRPDVARRVAVIKKGARIGGSFLAAMRLLHLAVDLPLPAGAPGEQFSGVIVAPDMRLGSQTYRYVKGAVENVPTLRRMRVATPKQERLVLRRKDGREVAIEVLPATAGGRALRGRSLVGAVLSEVAFFRDANYAINDAEIFAAVMPRIVAGGQAILESTPWAEMGLLFDLFTANFGDPRTAVVANAPTLVVRPELQAIVDAERERDPENARREYDAEWLTVGARLLFDPATIDASVDDTLICPAPARIGGRCATGDLGFKSDSSTLAIFQMSTQVAELSLFDEVRPERGKPLVPGQVMARFARAIRGYGASTFLLDGHYIESAKEHAAAHKIRVWEAPGGAPGKLETHLAAKEMFAEQRVRLPAVPRIIEQLKAIRSRPLPGGGIQISTPRRRSGHGDIASAIVLGLWAMRQANMTSFQREAERARLVARELRAAAGMNLSGHPTLSLPSGWTPQERVRVLENLSAGEPWDLAVKSTWRRIGELDPTLVAEDARRSAEEWAEYLARFKPNKGAAV